MAKLFDLLRQHLAARALVLACDLHGPTVDLLIEQTVRLKGWLPPAKPQRLDS